MKTRSNLTNQLKVTKPLETLQMRLRRRLPTLIRTMLRTNCTTRKLCDTNKHLLWPRRAMAFIRSQRKRRTSLSKLKKLMTHSSTNNLQRSNNLMSRYNLKSKFKLLKTTRMVTQSMSKKINEPLVLIALKIQNSFIFVRFS